ncbi:MAG: hypothetical protein K9L86_08420 [Candidatus Omnitrophica bacterium]|nr:hypothetical protein [Candidatus Omnitrophota bacterium]
MFVIKIKPERKIDIIVRIGLYISLGLLIASFVQKGVLPKKKAIHPDLYQEPIQRETYTPSFEAKAEGSIYDINPSHHYKLNGLVVSQHDSTAWWDYYHKKWGDSLNLKDVCVIWGDNLENETYRRMRFRNGNWTCYVSVNHKTADQDWAQFNMAALSNNHLLSDKAEINQALRKVHVGDQIYLKGYLASYHRQGSHFSRDSSISRTDEGDGACETIYLTDFKVLKSANFFWWSVYGVSKYLVLILFIFLVFLRIQAPLSR